MNAWRKDYQYQRQHRFLNPFFREKKQRRIKRLIFLRRSAFFFISFLILGLLSYAFLFAPWWTIEKIEIKGVRFMSTTPIEEMIQQQMSNRRLLFLPQNHVWFFSQKQLIKKIAQSYSFEKFSLAIGQRHLILEIVERNAEVIWLSPSAAFLIDGEGTVIRALDEIEMVAIQKDLAEVEGPFPLLDYLRALPKIIPEREEVVMAGEDILVKDGINKIAEVAELMKSNNLAVQNFIVEKKTSAWVRSNLLNEDFYVLFDLTTAMEDQVRNLLLVLQQEVKNRATLKYIDVRFENHVYVQGGD